jgi:proteasome lid subunit RPN8/RPN11
MATVQAAPETGFWTTPEFPYTVEYSLAALDGIRAASVEGMMRLRHGGVEVGGVLFGRRTGTVLRILAYRSFICEYAYGPSFTLSEHDRSALRRLIDSSPQDPELSGMEVLGWYRSHTRGGIELSERDRSIYDTFFPEPWHISLVLRPEDSGVAQAWFFVRGANSPGFTLAPVISARPAPPSADPPPAPAGDPVEPPPAPHRRRFAKMEIPPPLYEQPRNRSGWLWAAAALVLAMALALAVFTLSPRRPTTPGHARLRIFDDGAALQIEWDRNEPALRGASSGRLIIQDGNQRTEVELDAATLHNGAITYQRRSPNVTVQLIVPTIGGDFTTASRFLGQPVQPPPGSLPPPEPVAIPKPPAYTEPESAPSGLSVSRPAPPPGWGAGSQIREPAPLVARNTTQVPEPAFSPQTAVPAGSQPQQPAPAIPPAPDRPQPLPSQPPVVAPAAEPYRGLQSGRAIWTGRLRNGQRLEINGERASSGSLTGRLPPAPLRVNVYPGEFRRDGVIVYGPARPTEAPSAKNGWTRTQYRPNSGRSRQLALLEAPSAANQWKKLVLSTNRDVAMIVIYWEVIPEAR